MVNLSNHDSCFEAIFNTKPMKLLTRIPAWIRSKYFIAFAAFCVVLLFLDKNDIFAKLERRSELRKLEKSRDYYQSRISAERKELAALKNNPATLERYAREKSLMKRDNEELFLVPEKSDNPKN